MGRAFIFTSDALFSVYLMIIIISILFLISYQPKVETGQSQNIAADVLAVMREYKIGYALNDSNYPYANYLINNGKTSNWLMFKGSPARTSNTTSKAPNSNTTYWAVGLTGNTFSSPAVYNGRVFISTENFTYAIDEATGIVLWSIGIGANSSPAIDSSKVFLGSKDNRTYALNSLTGEVIWNVSLQSPTTSSPAVHNGEVFIASYDGTVYAFDEESGAQMWNQTPGGAIYSSPTIAYGKIFLTSTDGYIYALDETSGAVLWSDRLATGSHAMNLKASPAAADGMIFINSEPNRIEAYNESTGALIWGLPTGGGKMYSSSPAVADGRVFVCDDNALTAANELNGNYNWSYVATITYSSPAVADRKVFVGTDDGNLLALDEMSGSLIWSYYIGGLVQSSPAVADGRVYIANQSGTLFSFGDCSISDLNKTLLDLAGDFWSIGRADCAANTFQEFFQSGHAANSNSLLHLRFNEGSGSTTAGIANNYSGVLNNSPQWTTGKFGTALYFNGTNQFVNVSASPSWVIGKNNTVELWFKTNDTSNSTQTLFCKYYQAYGGCSYSVSINAGKQYLYFTMLSVRQSAQSTINFSDGNWHHLAATFAFLNSTDPGGPLGSGSVYLDGNLIVSGSGAPGLVSGPMTDAAPFYAAAGNPGWPVAGWRYFNGTIDDVAVYNRTKNLTEIQSDYMGESVIPSRYGFELAIYVGSGAGVDCSGNASDWDTIMTNDCGQSKYTRLLVSSKQVIPAASVTAQAVPVSSAKGPTLIRMDVWN